MTEGYEISRSLKPQSHNYITVYNFHRLNKVIQVYWQNDNFFRRAKGLIGVWHIKYKHK